LTSLPSQPAFAVKVGGVESPDPKRLATSDLFRGLSEADRATVASWMDVEVFRPDRPIVHADDSGYVFFVIDEGRARAEHDGRVLEILEPGAVFGEIAFFAPDGRRTATVVPETPLRVFAMHGTRFRQMQKEMPEVAARLEEVVRERIARMRDPEQP
jgi:CRP-like cAMP-binding protein